ncbi:hypothetical protein RR49_00027 [Microbacterium ginsengisoli]|uniref:Uncharacterized protein n=1 Tax=Microbacterium ginsengisoli TaxID=400772 RepID=A0A0F0M3Z2_9MICO|nr:hypothetical protein RR49_00027 [Microbacterium ginsengisoli]
MPSLGSSPSRVRASSGPSRRMPTRSLSVLTRQGLANRASTAVRVNQSSRGPSATGSSSVSAGAVHGNASTTGIGDAGSAPIDSRSPAPSGAGPSAESVSVAREPASSGTSTPPRTATMVRMPRRGHPISSTDPAGQAVATYAPIGTRSTVTSPQAPVTATQRSQVARSAVPPPTTSMPASPSTLPTSRFATRSAARSRAPDRAMPRCARCGRPRSWSVAETPTRRTSNARRGAVGSTFGVVRAPGAAAGVPRAESSAGPGMAGSGFGAPGARPGSATVPPAASARTAPRTTSRAETNRTAAPGSSNAGRAPRGSKSGASVRPMRRHPPGVARG